MAESTFASPPSLTSSAPGGASGSDPKKQFKIIAIGGVAAAAVVLYIIKKRSASSSSTASGQTQAGTPEVIYPSSVADNSSQDEYDSLMTGITNGTGITANNISAAQQQLESYIGSNTVPVSTPTTPSTPATPNEGYGQTTIGGTLYDILGIETDPGAQGYLGYNVGGGAPVFYDAPGSASPTQGNDQAVQGAQVLVPAIYGSNITATANHSPQAG